MTSQSLFTPQAPPQGSNTVPLEKATVLLSLAIGTPGKRRKGNLDEIDTDADKTMLGLSKELFESAEMATIEKENGALRRRIYNLALQVPALFRSGVYVLPVRLVDRVDEMLRSHAIQTEDRARLFARAYPRLIADARQRLGAQFNKADYPLAYFDEDGSITCNQEALIKAFTVKWQYVTLGTPDALQSVNREVWEREKAKTAAAWKQAGDEIRQLLRATFAELVSHMNERLKPDNDGKPKVFRDTMVRNLAEFLETFPLRNVMGDSDLAALVDRARDMMQGVTTKDLRSNEALRDATARNVAEIKAQLDTMVAEGDARLYRI